VDGTSAGPKGEPGTILSEHRTQAPRVARPAAGPGTLQSGSHEPSPRVVDLRAAQRREAAPARFHARPARPHRVGPPGDDRRGALLVVVARNRTLPASTIAPEDFARVVSGRPSRLVLLPDPAMDNEALIGWLQLALGLLQSAANSLDFFDRAAQAIVDLAGMDSGRVMLWENGRFQ